MNAIEAFCPKHVVRGELCPRALYVPRTLTGQPAAAQRFRPLVL